MMYCLLETSWFINNTCAASIYIHRKGRQRAAESRREAPKKRKQRIDSGQAHCYRLCSFGFEVFQLPTAKGNHIRQTLDSSSKHTRQLQQKLAAAAINQSIHVAAVYPINRPMQQSFHAAIYPSKQAINPQP
jgi:hypothetical protein